MPLASLSLCVTSHRELTEVDRLLSFLHCGQCDGPIFQTPLLSGGFEYLNQELEVGACRNRRMSQIADCVRVGAVPFDQEAEIFFFFLMSGLDL